MARIVYSWHNLKYKLMITKNSNNAGLFKDIEGSKYTEPKQAKQDRVALLYFVENNNDEEAEIYSASDILLKDGDDCIFAAKILAIVQKYYKEEHIVLSMGDMKDVMGRYVADNDFSDESVEFAKEAIRGYELSVKEGSRVIMLPVDTYAQALK